MEKMKTINHNLNVANSLDFIIPKGIEGSSVGSSFTCQPIHRIPRGVEFLDFQLSYLNLHYTANTKQASPYFEDAYC
jgi:hypothetical protein